jgi:hypothetical protein
MFSVPLTVIVTVCPGWRVAVQRVCVPEPVQEPPLVPVTVAPGGALNVKPRARLDGPPGTWSSVALRPMENVEAV